MSADELQLDLGTVTMNCSTDEVAETLSALLDEMRTVIPKLREDERDMLRQIMSQDSGALTVGAVFPEFSRESEAHKTLRRLRAAQFVRPSRTGRWDPDVPIEVKPFARLMWDHIGEDTIFDGVPAAPALGAAAAPAEEEVDLGLTAPEDAVVEEAPAAEEPATEPAAGEQPADDDVVDLGAVEEENEPAQPARKGAAVANFEDDNVLDVGDLDDLYAYAQEEVRGKG